MQNLATDILACEARIAANRRLAGLLSRGRETEALRRERLVVKADTVLRQLELLSLLWDVEDEKAGFRPDQPRHPRGSGRISGRWSGGAGTIIDPADPAAAVIVDPANPAAAVIVDPADPAATIIVDPADPAATIIITPAGGPPTRRGHHFIPQSVFNELDIPPEARKVFNDAVTGVTPGHGWSREHKTYNDAVRIHVQHYMRAHSIRPTKMTADQARAIIRSVLESENPDIQYFNRTVMMLRLIYQLRKKPPTGRR